MAEKVTRRSGMGASLDEGDLLNLRVSAAVAQAFRLEAVRRHLRQNALFEEMWRVYQEAHDANA